MKKHKKKGEKEIKIFYLEDFEDAPGPRYGHSSTLIEEKIIFFGGLNLKRDKFFNDINIFDADAEAFLTEIIPNPKLKILGRHFHSTVFDTHNKHLLFFGGKSNGYLNDIVVFDVVNEKFLPCLNEKNMKGDIPSKRYGCSAVYFKGNMFVFGGYNSSGFDCNDLLCFNIKKREWKRYLTKIPHRYLYGDLLIDENKWFIFHGLSKKLKSLFDVWQIEFLEKKKEVTFEISPVKVKKNVFDKKSKNFGQSFFISEDKIYCYGRRDEKQSLFLAKLLSNKKGKIVGIEWKKNPFPFVNNSFFSYGSVSVDKPNSTLYFFGGLKITDEKELEKELERKKKEALKKKATIKLLGDDLLKRILSFLTRHDVIVVRSASKKKLRLSVLAGDNYIWNDFYKDSRGSLPPHNSMSKYVTKIDKKLNKIKNSRKRTIMLKQMVRKREEKIRKEYGEKYEKIRDGVKCVVVGDGACGKTSLLMTYANDKFPSDYIPTVFENYNATTVYNDKPARLNLWDTAGEEDYDVMRPLSYADADVFIVLFSIVDPVSLENVKTKWVPEIFSYEPDAPRVLAGSKLDLREDRKVVQLLMEKREKPITTKEGMKMAKELKFHSYYEYSALENIGVKELFNGALKAIVEPEKSVKDMCGIQ